jgi:hypothetical protein
MVEPLHAALIQRPGEAFGRAFEDPAYGFLHPVDLERAQVEHDGFVATLRGLGVVVSELGVETDDPDLVYTFDASLVTDRGAILLRSGKANRVGEEAIHAVWYKAHGIPIIGAIESPGTVDGGDTFWIDSETDLPVRESGRFVKSPSVFFKTVDFAREYETKDGFSVPKKMNTVVLTRLWGQVELDILYDGFRWQEAPRVAQTPIPSNESH